MRVPTGVAGVADDRRTFEQPFRLVELGDYAHEARFIHHVFVVGDVNVEIVGGSVFGHGGVALAVYVS
jgi:hypothetical protein